MSEIQEEMSLGCSVVLFQTSGLVLVIRLLIQIVSLVSIATFGFG